jgi:hypothetical protein
MSAFVADFKTRSGLTKMPDVVSQWLLLAWFVTVRGCEHVGDNGDRVVMGHGCATRATRNPTLTPMVDMVAMTPKPNHVHLNRISQNLTILIQIIYVCFCAFRRTARTGTPR